MSDTAKKPLKNPKFTPDIGKDYQFGKQEQPSPESKKAGKQRKKFSRELIKALLDETIPDNLDGAVIKKLKEYYPDLEGVTFGEIITKRMIIQALIGKNPEQAFEKIMNQAFGAPKQAVDVTSDGKSIKSNVIRLSNGTEISI